MANRLLFVANPNFNVEKHALAGADEEVNSIVVDLLPTISPKPEVLGPLYHAEATEEKFRTLVAEGPSVIHFSGHGVFDSDNPWMSQLRFYAEDGYSPYTITEMLLHRFPKSPLFVLSACETARGRISRGDEAIGILRGLTLAGATSILATNWRLSDSVAPYFMYNFYQHFLEGETAAEALFNARRDLYEDVPEFEKPVHWAVYELFGNPFKHIGGSDKGLG